MERFPQSLRRKRQLALAVHVLQDHAAQYVLDLLLNRAFQRTGRRRPCVRTTRPPPVDAAMKTVHNPHDSRHLKSVRECAMATEPMTLFARIADPAGVARRLRELAPSVKIDGPDDNWRNAVVSFGMLWRKRRLTLTHDPAYYAGPDWAAQMDGMRGYFS